MTTAKITRLLNTAGKHFFIFHIEDIMECFERMEEDTDYKTRKIAEYYKAQNGFKSKDEYGVRVRVNAVLQIIRANAVKDALKMINIQDSAS